MSWIKAGVRSKVVHKNRKLAQKIQKLSNTHGHAPIVFKKEGTMSGRLMKNGSVMNTPRYTVQHVVLELFKSQNYVVIM